MKRYLFDIANDHRHEWYDHGVKFLLWLVSLVYAVVVRILRWLYRQQILPAKSLPRPVICVGNLVVGGSGKTPIVMALAEYANVKGLQPVILSRGYMAGQKVLSDEAAMIKELLPTVPVFTASERYAAGMQAFNQVGADLFIMDDGFQHWKLRRDLDIVVVDAFHPFGNGHVLPRGLLRESPQALSQADVIVLAKGEEGSNLDEQINAISHINSRALIVATGYVPDRCWSVCHTTQRYKPDVLTGKRVVAVCGIGQPDKFLNTLNNLGADVVAKEIYMDHAVYQQSDVDRWVVLFHKHDADYIVVTHKDAVKVQSLQNDYHEAPILVLGMRVAFIRGQQALWEKVNEVISV